MNSPSLQPIGVYRWPHSERDIKKLCRDAYGDVEPDHLAETRERLANLVIIELYVRDLPPGFDLGDVNQNAPNERRDSSQAPYAEHCWSADGSTLIEEYAMAKTPPFRVAFFLHYFDATKPLYMKDGTIIPLPQPSELPKHIKKVMKYEQD